MKYFISERNLMEEREQKFLQEHKISLKEAIEKVNRKTWDAIDYNFMQAMYEDEDVRPTVEKQIEDIESQLDSVMQVKDNFTQRIITKAVNLYDTTKRENDDTRMARKVLDKERIINNIINWPWTFNPLLQANINVYGKSSYPLIYSISKAFKKRNREHLITVCYDDSRHIKCEKVIVGHEQMIQFNREDILDIDLRLYPFYIRRIIQNANRSELTIMST